MSSSHEKDATGPLSGYRVIDMSRILAGPWAGQLLADLGADVIKIEHPAGGDDTRHWGPPFMPDTQGEPTDTAAYYLAANRGKRSVTLDLRRAGALQVVRDLVSRSDVFIENFKVGGLARYGLDFATLTQLNPKLVYCSITGFGQNGPYAERPGYDLLIQAMGGLMSITGPADDEPAAGACKVGVAITDLCAGLYATVAIQAALLERDRSGAGQYIDLSLLDVQTAMLANQATNYLVGGVVPGRMGSAHPNIAPYQSFATADGEIVIAVGNDRQFEVFTRLAGEPALANDPRFSSNRQRVVNRKALIVELDTLLKRHTSVFWLDLLQDSEVPCGPVNKIDAVFSDRQVNARGMRRRYAHPLGGELELVANPIRYSRSASNCGLAPPELGADTVTVLRELGYDDEAIAALRSESAIGND